MDMGQRNQREAKTIKIGPRVPEGVWDEFKTYCEDKNGKKGTAGEELAKAMQYHMGDGGEDDETTIADQLTTLNTKLDYILNSVHTIESWVGAGSRNRDHDADTGEVGGVNNHRRR